MKKLNPAHISAVLKKVNSSPYFSLLSMEITSLDLAKCRMETVIEEKHLQPYGHVHGGVYSSLVDAAAFWALYCQIDDRVGLTTVEMKLNYLAPSSGGRLITEGRSIKAGKTLCLGEASIEDEEGKLLAHGTATMMVLESLGIKGHSDFPPKFLD